MEFIRLSESAQKLMAKATEESTRLDHHFLGVEHLFMMLTQDDEILLNRAFSDQKMNMERFSEALRQRIVTVEHRPWGSELLITPRCRQVMQLADTIATRSSSAEVGKEHILEAIFREGRSVPLRLLRSFEIDPALLYEVVRPTTKPAAETRTPTLEQYGQDLTLKARQGRFGPLIGRGPELELVAEVLLRKNKNNPVLVGEAGVGKTAVVEGFARQLVSDDCPRPLAGCRIVELSTASMVAGTKYRGEFEERLLKILEEASADPKLILFLDEIHTLVGAGASSGDSLDASNILKPALARGDLRCIGATTMAEYRRFIEKDAALERRFEPVHVEEPTRSEAHEILQGVRQSLEAHHEVRISPEAVSAAVDLTVRYLPHRRLPDKAIDALDQSCARARLRGLSGTDTADAEPVSAENVACTVSQSTGVPLERISGEEAKHLLGLEEQLRGAVVGQNHAIGAVTRSILTAKAGLSDPNRPTGVFLFLGPTGVGKTELAKALAQSLFGDGKRLIRFDMSEYGEPHSVAKLIGAPPGYVGHDTEGLLISAVRTHPHSVVLFDELEKAHAQVFDLFLQIFDDGRLSGAHGVTADFTNTVIILTSNLGLQAPEQKATVGFTAEQPAPDDTDDPRGRLMLHLRPELINRIDDVIVFNPLEKAALRQIIDRFVQEIEELAASRDLALKLEPPVYEFLIDRAISDRFGARELRRVVDRQLRQPLAEALLQRGERAGSVRIGLGAKGISFDWD